MITTVPSDNCHAYRGSSTDSKPDQNVANGSTFYEIDTGKAFIFNGNTEAWVEISQGFYIPV